ncbi:hypothetical protein [Pseudoduganella sp. HUAS MS19]
MSLNTLVGKSLDRIFRETAGASSFSKQRASGPDLRRFFHETGHAQREILYYRDKRWSASGGTLYAEICCLVPTLQQAVHGVMQSLQAPDYSIPSSHFQYALSEHEPRRAWPIHSPEDVAAFEREMADWLPSVALPWLAQFETSDGVIQFMRTKGNLVMLAIFLASLGDSEGAMQAVAAWLENLPRQIENKLRRLVRSGLIAPADESYLALASIQSEEDYRLRIAEWLAAKQDGVGT